MVTLEFMWSIGGSRSLLPGVCYGVLFLWVWRKVSRLLYGCCSLRRGLQRKGHLHKLENPGFVPYVMASFYNDCIVLRKHFFFFSQCLFPGTGLAKWLELISPQRSIVIITMKRTSTPGITIPAVKLRPVALTTALQENLKVIPFLFLYVAIIIYCNNRSTVRER